MFEFLIDILTKNGKGIHAYRACAEKGYAAAADHPDAAAPLMLLARSAEAFADMNERMPITATDIDTAYEQFCVHVARLNAAWESESDAEKLAVLNAVALDLIGRQA